MDELRRRRYHEVVHEAVYVDFEESEWCNRCMLPSAVTWLRLVYNALTLRLIKSDRCFMCRDCAHYYVISEASA